MAITKLLLFYLNLFYFLESQILPIQTLENKWMKIISRVETSNSKIINILLTLYNFDYLSLFLHALWIKFSPFDRRDNKMITRSVPKTDSDYPNWFICRTGGISIAKTNEFILTTKFSVLTLRLYRAVRKTSYSHHATQIIQGF